MSVFDNFSYFFLIFTYFLACIAPLQAEHDTSLIILV